LQARQVAEIIQRLSPDVVLLNEFNYDEAGRAADLFQQNFLGVPQNASSSPSPSDPIHYPYRYLAPSNTGIPSGFDLNTDGQIASDVGTRAYGDDAFGFGEFPGRYGMLLLSKYPILETQVRTFQRFLWRDMPGALLPDDLSTPAPGDWYSPEELNVVRLSSKSHWDVPIQIGDRQLHLLLSHPTPPAFDGPEDRNGRRNHDEIRLWADYLSPETGDYLVDDQGRGGALSGDASFVIMGDLNADPDKGDSFPGAIAQLLGHPRVNSTVIPTTFSGNSDTATFNLRVDYVLPSNNLTLLDTAVFRPENTDPLARLLRASDHRLVWADIELLPVPEPTSRCMLALAAVTTAVFRGPRRLVA
jgi:3-phytase